MDTFTKAKRSEVMAAVRSTANRSTEKRLASALRFHKVSGWRRHRRISLKKGAVRPDFVFPMQKVAVFVDGCFFHCCPVHGRKPSSRMDYWLPKLEANRRRDRRVSSSLRRLGWVVIRIWEHSLQEDVNACVKRIVRFTSSQDAK